MHEVILDGASLSIERIQAVARQGAKVSVSSQARQNVQRSRDVIEKSIAEGAAIYGVTTGIGEFARIRISPEQSAELQRRIIYSHSAGTGDPFPPDVVRAGMTCRANTLSKGCSGVRVCLLDTVLEMINKGVVPFINEKGSVGTSGDLSPLSQFAEVAIGEGRAYYKGELMPGAEAMRRAGVKPTDLTCRFKPRSRPKPRRMEYSVWTTRRFDLPNPPNALRILSFSPPIFRSLLIKAARPESPSPSD